jgi:glycosyltransferase involved in cell wall biosynthesis
MQSRGEIMAKLSGDRPRVSIGMPVYNGANFLPEALDSVLAQTVDDFELIISDNASTDGTQQICQHYAEGDDRIIYLRQEKNVGAAQNFNLLVDRAKSAYFRWACHDDILHPRCLEVSIEILNEHPDVVLAYPESVMIGADGEILEDENFPIRELHLLQDAPHDRLKEYLWKYVHGGLCNPLYGVMRTTVLASTSRIRPYPASDLALLGELALAGKVFRVTEPLFFRRYHSEKSTLANETDSELISWFDPDTDRKFVPKTWKYLSALARAVLRWVPNTRERTRCFRLLTQIYIRQKRKILMREAKHTFQQNALGFLQIPLMSRQRKH